MQVMGNDHNPPLPEMDAPGVSQAVVCPGLCSAIMGQRKTALIFIISSALYR